MKNNTIIFSIGLVTYFALHAISRILISDSLQVDEAEQILLSQLSFQWGYNAEPPLYTWLQIILFQIFPSKIMALAVFKNLLLATSFFFTYLIAKHILQDTTKAMICCCSLIFIPAISWEGQRDLSHSVLMLALCTMTLFVLLKLLEKQHLIYYILAGVLIGLGCISKYTFVIFITTLIGSWFFFAKFRQVVCNKKSLVTIFLIIVIAGGHFVWFFLHYTNISFEAKINQYPRYRVLYTLNSICNVIQAATLFSLPFLGIFTLLFGKDLLTKSKRPLSPAKSPHPLTPMLGAFYAASIVFFIIIVAILSISKFKQRWFIPFLFTFPIYLFLHLENRGYEWKNKAREYILLAAISACLIFAALVGRVLIADYTDKYNKLNDPYRKIALQLKEHGFENGVIIGEDQLIAANLKLHFSQSLAICPRIHFPVDNQKTFLVVWESRKVYPPFRKFIRNIIPNFSHKKAQTITAQYKYGKDDFKLHFVICKIAE